MRGCIERPENLSPINGEQIQKNTSIEDNEGKEHPLLK